MITELSLATTEDDDEEEEGDDGTGSANNEQLRQTNLGDITMKIS